MPPKQSPGGEPLGPEFDDPDLDAVFARASPADTIAAVLTEARLVLAEVDRPLNAELWGSDIVAALGAADNHADAIAEAAEQAGTPEAMAALCALAAVGPDKLRAAASEAADRLTALGVSRPAWAEAIGHPTVGLCWCYGDALGEQEVVTISFRYGDSEHVISVLLDSGQGGGIKNVWIGDSGDLLDRTRKMAQGDPAMRFKMITQSDARARMDRAIAAGECPQRQEETAAVASTRALLRSRVALLPR
jgi:hypothetical protein